MPELYHRDMSRHELQSKVGRLQQVAGVRLLTLGDGVERGIRILEFRSGTGFIFEVLVDRAFDIGRCEYNGYAIGWQSPTGFTGPWYYEPEGFGFLRSFGGGLLTTCGLDHTLFQTEDTAHQYQYPPKTTESYGLHGRIANRPAKLTGYGENWDGNTCTLWAEGEILQASALGENLLLKRRIECKVGESHFRIMDRVENLGPHLTPHMYLYHVNVGFPIVDEGSEIWLPYREAHPMGDYPVEGFAHIDAPDANYTERVYEYEPISGTNGEVTVAIVNPALEVGMYQIYQRNQLPHPFIWRMLGKQHYVVGLEPSTNRVAGRHDARERDELIVLQSDESRDYSMTLGVFEGQDALKSFHERIEALRE